MLAKQLHFYTPEEYLALEEKAEYKSEYYQGEIVAMAGASINHNRITRNVVAALTNAFAAKPCEAFASDLRLWLEKRQYYTYPDVMVVCGDLEFVKGRTDTITNPKVIIEVLSESTENYDRSKKFHAYWTLDSLAEYVLIDQYRPRVEYFRQVSEKEWLLRVLTKVDDVLKLETIGVEIPLETIYHNVAWEEQAQAE
jgi:Uma2 family endonuclease